MKFEKIYKCILTPFVLPYGFIYGFAAGILHASIIEPCRFCGEPFEHKLDSQQYRCPHCQGVHIEKNYTHNNSE